MNIEKLWNNMNFDERMNLLNIPNEFPVTRMKKWVCESNWVDVYEIEQKLIREIYTHKKVIISFKIECNEIGIENFSREFREFLISKKWSCNDIKIHTTHDVLLMKKLHF